MSGRGDEILLRGGDGNGDEPLHVLVLPLILRLLGALLSAPLLGPPDGLQLTPGLAQHAQVNAGLGPHHVPRPLGAHQGPRPRAGQARDRGQCGPTQVCAGLGHQEGLASLVTAEILNQLE